MLHLAQQLAPFPSILCKSDGMALVRQGDRQAPLVKLFRCFSGSPELDWPAWHRNRICKDAFDWQTKGSAGDGRGLNSAWWPDVNGLAIQSQMAKRPRHQCQSFNCLRLLCQSLCHTIVNKIYSVLVGSFTPWLPRPSQGILIRGVEAVRILLTTIGPSGRNGKAKFRAQNG